MAFGDTAVLLSAFAGADENPLSEGGNWAKVDLDSLADMTLVSHQASNNQPAPAFGNVNYYWTPQTFGPDVDVYYTVGNNGSALDLLLRLDGVGVHAGEDGYWLQIVGANWGIFYILGGVSHALTSAVQAIAAGDKIGFGVNCYTLTGYRNTGAGWASILSVVDTRFDRTGFVGIGAAQNTDKIDDVYAGTVPRLSPCTGGHPLPLLGVGT